MSANTPTPWSVVDDGQSWPHIAAEYTPDGTICEMSAEDPQNEGNGDRARERALANAHRIVRAVNSHEELLAAIALADEVERLANMLACANTNY